jgi:hypothetical protein
MHVPLLACWPGRIPAGQQVDALVDFADFYPTFLDVAEVPTDRRDAVDGLSFAPLFFGKNRSISRSYVTGGVKGNFAVFDGQWRLQAPDSLLFDCRELPEERPADLSIPEAQEAMKRLLPILSAIMDTTKTGA